MSILTINLVLSTFIFWMVARRYLFPRLGTMTTSAVLVPILILHAFRHLGLMFLAPGATYAGMPPQFAYPAAYGDCLAAILAVIAIPSVVSGGRSARPLVWIFNLEGSLDLIMAIALATAYGAQAYMGAAYWIPAFWVPALLVTHYITFLLLAKPWNPQT